MGSSLACPCIESARRQPPGPSAWAQAAAAQSRLRVPHIPHPRHRSLPLTPPPCLATRRAPVPWQDIELEELPALDSTCSCPTASGLSLDFRCSQLLSGSAAEASLRRLQPSLAGRGALLNVGEMRLCLPPEAAVALLGGAAGPADGVAKPVALQQQTPSPRQGGGATAAQRAAGGQRRLTGGGSGGGTRRVVADAEDDW